VNQDAGPPQRWRLAVDPDVCISSGVCTGCAPDAFELVGRASRPLRSDVQPQDAILDAALACPVEAISVVEMGTGAVLAPEP